MAQAVQKRLSPYRNENLFSRHYLKNVIQRTNIWSIDEEEIEDAFNELEKIYQREKDYLPNREDDEEELRNDFITPILRRVLNFKKEQEKKSGGSQKIPDYALYDTSEKKKKALDTGRYYEHAIGLVEAKAWKKDLEKKTNTGDPSTDDSNPTKQIVDYLIENKPQWGILTNGNKWRLVHREASNRLDTYYEVDILNLLASDRSREEKLSEFKYFYIFFRKQAFQGDEGSKLLDEILEESVQYAEEIGADLESNIYKALEWLAKGYIENNSNDGIEDVPIKEIHDNSLIYLYRLLFALYADSRGILGDPGGKYEYYNFSELVDEVCKELDEGDGYGKSGLISNRLNAIFRMIDDGSQSQDIPKDELHIPAYNGGLFSQERHEFLKKYNLHDKYLAKVIDLVSRTKIEEGGKARVDYYDLSVRHLGGIYEGLLEYQLEKADEDMVEVKEDGNIVVKTLDEADENGDSFSEDDTIREGQPYLVTDDGERKATGSYYTPDYIVKYIVENTVGPKVEDQVEGLESDEEKAEAILDMQILDPAMGSAHFLVEVIDYLATELVEYKEVEIEQAKREVARKCIYGVDINPLATELGKLSIWLKTISEDKPLSFLDHHIKTGNSLIGADIHNINRHPEEDEDSDRQVTLGEEFDDAGVVRANVKEMLKKFKKIQEKQADSPEDIKKQEQLYEEFLDFPFRKRFDVLADVYTSHYFDNDYKVDDYNRLLQAFKLQEQKEEEDNEEWNDVVKEDWVQKATDSLDDSHREDNTSKQKGFFHWKLEFPEVFFDIEEGVEKGNSGFDAVVGNPPYGYRGIPTQHEKDYLERNFKTHEYNYENYLYFTELSVDLLNQTGLQGYIIPNTFLSADKMQIFRDFLLENNTLSELFYLGQGVFEGVTLESVIEIIDQRKESKDVKVKISKNSSTENPDKSYNGDLERFRDNDNKVMDIDLTPKRRKVVSKMEETSVKLEELSYVTVGINTGYIRDEMTSDQKEDERYHKMLNGKHISRYEINWDGKWIIYDKEFVDSFGDKGRTLPPERIFTEPKILLQRTRRGLERKLVAVLDDEKHYNLNRVSNVVLEDEDYSLNAILGILNSSLLDRYFDWVFNEYEVKPSHLKKLPIINEKPESINLESGDLDNNSDYKNILEDSNKNERISLISVLSEKIQELIQQKSTVNTEIKDYLGNYSEGKTLGEMYIPVEGLSDSILTDTKEERDNIKIGSVEFEEKGSSLILNVSVKYKPEDDEGFDEDELDRWGYTETEKLPAMNFTVGDRMKALIKEFVPVAVDEASGFANFREKATKTNSVVDRLEDLTLPKLDDVEQGLEKFIDNKEQAEELEREIQKTDELIDAIVFDLYDLDEEDVKTVFDSLDAYEDKKDSILDKFREIREEE